MTCSTFFLVAGEEGGLQIAIVTNSVILKCLGAVKQQCSAALCIYVYLFSFSVILHALIPVENE